jgi:hypothetical protein
VGYRASSYSSPRHIFLWLTQGPSTLQHKPVGWEPDNDGFRGYVFATDDNSTVVLSIKGTSAQWVDKGPTTDKDKTNDNLLFSCCCARINWSWTTVCDCYRGGWKCNQDCLEDALMEESLFYPIGTVRRTILSNLLCTLCGGVDSHLWFSLEPLQQYHVDVSPLKYLGHRPFLGWLAGITDRNHFRCASRDIRAAGRAHGRRSLAPSIARTHHIR